MPRFPYNFFDEFVVRTPVLSYKEFQDIYSENTNDEKLNEIFSKDFFKEAIYLASPDLNKRLEKFGNNSFLNKEQYFNLKNTFQKYFNRMSTRCTPFGLFSGVGIGKFDNENYFPKYYSEWLKIRETKPDMHFLVSLSKYLLSIPYIKNEVLFFPNNSIYKIGKKIRYIEYANIDGKREYIISTVPLSCELERVLNFSQKGKKLSEITSLIVNSEISKEEVSEYISEVVDSQILVSEFEPNVAGTNFLDSVISILERIGADREKNILISFQDGIKKLDSNPKNPTNSYLEIEEIIKTIGVDYEQKYLFQTDLYFENQLRLAYKWKRELKKGISFLNKITQLNNEETFLEKFKKAFYERFESEEVPLAFALDTEIGIGYRQGEQTKGIHPYIEDLQLPNSNKKQNTEIKLNTFQTILSQKLQNAILENKYYISLYDNDFPEFKENWNDLPDTLYFMTEIVTQNNQQKLFLDFGSGNAGRLFARFCSEKSNLKQLVKKISEKQEQLKSEKILAEIIHLPEARIGNVIRRPQIRKYEIPYLAKSLLSNENQILVEDLYLSIKGEKLLLHSKKYDKEVLSYLTNAHNHSLNSLPVYHFLCDYATQNIRTSLQFDWGDLAKIYNFLPRVEYENIILSKARWKISKDELGMFTELLKNPNKELISKEIENWRSERQIPQWVQWVEFDNTLAVNFRNWDLILMFFSSIRNEKEVFIEEFLVNENENFCSQFIFPFYKNLG